MNPNEQEEIEQARQEIYNSLEEKIRRHLREIHGEKEYQIIWQKFSMASLTLLGSQSSIWQCDLCGHPEILPEIVTEHDKIVSDLPRPGPYGSIAVVRWQIGDCPSCRTCQCRARLYIHQREDPDDQLEKFEVSWP